MQTYNFIAKLSTVIKMCWLLFFYIKRLVNLSIKNNGNHSCTVKCLMMWYKIIFRKRQQAGRWAGTLSARSDAVQPGLGLHLALYVAAMATTLARSKADKATTTPESCYTTRAVFTTQSSGTTNMPPKPKAAKWLRNIALEAFRAQSLGKASRLVHLW